MGDWTISFLGRISLGIVNCNALHFDLCCLQTKYSYLDVIGRTVVVLEKKNVVPEHNVPFQVISVPNFIEWLMPF